MLNFQFNSLLDVVYQQRVRGFHQGFQTPRNIIVSRCLEPLMKPEARVFDMATQSRIINNR